MKKCFLLVLFVSLLLTVKTNAQTAAVAAPVLIELFTSQGCSSCPPAEALLNSWGMDLFTAKKALPLAFHVDYWDYLGWKDPYSSKEASDRQRAYGAFFQSNSIYTPQMVVQGQIGFNGSDSHTAKREFSEAQSSFLPTLGLSTQLGHKTIEAVISIPSQLSRQLSKDAVLYAVVFENGLSTSVERGENSGATLTESFVARSIKAIPAGDISGTQQKLSLPLAPGGKTSQMGLGVWFQDARTMKVQGLQWTYPLAKVQ